MKQTKIIFHGSTVAGISNHLHKQNTNTHPFISQVPQHLTLKITIPIPIPILIAPKIAILLLIIAPPTLIPIFEQHRTIINLTRRHLQYIRQQTCHINILIRRRIDPGNATNDFVARISDGDIKSVEGAWEIRFVLLVLCDVYAAGSALRVAFGWGRWDGLVLETAAGVLLKWNSMSEVGAL